MFKSLMISYDSGPEFFGSDLCLGSLQIRKPVGELHMVEKICRRFSKERS